MEKRGDMRRLSLSLVQGGLWLALVLALVGSLRHVAWAFATLENSDLMAGYVQAVAVDVGLVSLAYGIQERKRQARSTWVLWGGVGLFSAVSIYANTLHGLRYMTDIGLSAWAWLDAWRPFVLSAVLPVLVMYLSEVAGQNVNYAVKLAERERKAEERRLSRELSNAAEVDTLALARTVKAEQDAMSKAAILDTLLDIYRDNPGARPTQVARQIGRSRTTLYAYLSELEAAGRIRRNGQGIEVLTG